MIILLKKKFFNHGANRLASNSLIEAIVYADAAVKDAASYVNSLKYNELVPDWDDEGTKLPEEMVLITQSYREVEQIMKKSEPICFKISILLHFIYTPVKKLIKKTVCSGMIFIN